MNPISRTFIAALDRFVRAGTSPLITFPKGQRKDDLTQEPSRFSATEGTL